MTEHQNSTIAQLLFAEVLPLNILRLVADIEALLVRLGAGNRKLTWNCENIAFFDLPGTRIAIAWANGRSPGLATCLTLSVGPAPDMADKAQITTGYHTLCSRMVERLRRRGQPVAVLWHQSVGPVGADLLEDLLESLPSLPRKIKHRGYIYA